jgi:hypothetical protein
MFHHFKLREKSGRPSNRRKKERNSIHPHVRTIDGSYEFCPLCNCKPSSYLSLNEKSKYYSWDNNISFNTTWIANEYDEIP